MERRVLHERGIYCVALLGLAFSMLPQPLAAQTDASSQDAAGIILVVGAPGNDEYEAAFSAWADKWGRVARTSETPIKTIGLDDANEKEDRQQLQDVLSSVVPKGPRPLWLVLIGHGTYSGNVAKFNLRGPDVSAQQLATWLEKLERPVVIVNCASASGPFINRLSAPRRVIVTATKSGNEQNYARFGEYFASAIASPDSDLDHDDEVSVHEAFLRASAEVQQFYDADARLATEHALIDDNGDGKGTPATMFRGTRPGAKAKDGAKLDGPAASRVTLTPTGKRLKLTDAEIKERAEIEAELDRLRANREDFDVQAYNAKLEPLMIRLAKIYQAAEARAK